MSDRILTGVIAKVAEPIPNLLDASCRTPFFVWFRGRSGSTYLCDLLNSHPDIFCRKEDFSEFKVTPESPAPKGAKIVEHPHGNYFRRLYCFGSNIDDPSRTESIQHLFDILNHGEKACGFKLKFPVQFTVFPEVLETFELIKNEVRVITLHRDNVLKQAVSYQNLERFRTSPEATSCNLTKKVEFEPLVIDVHLMTSHANYFSRTRKEFESVVEKFPNVHSLSYENLLANQQATMKKVLSFLNVSEDAELNSRFKKATQDKMSDAVANYDEVVQAFKGTEFEEFLD